jgi:ADP-ribosylglycohydrolase
VADSLALGVHWVYSPDRIKKAFGRVDRLLKPIADSYHPTKDMGEFTHYGDQAFVLLQSVASLKMFDLGDFSSRWQELFSHYEGYYDQATRATLRHFSMGKGPENAGSSSTDLAGASRIAPLVFCYREDPEVMVKAARAQTAMTHNTRSVIDCAEFFARVCWMVLKGTPPVYAMEAVCDTYLKGVSIDQWVKEGIASRDMESIPAIANFGQSCHANEALPGAVHLIAKYENNLVEALVQAVMAGGDSAARGMVVGMVLGAHLGYKPIPDLWLSGMKRLSDIQSLMEAIA